MVDSIFSQGQFRPGMIARLKVSAPPKAQLSVGTAAASEKNIADIIKLSAEAKSKITDGQKLNAYLRTFAEALKIFNGSSFSSSFKPSLSTVEIEYIAMKKPGIDKKV